MSMPLVSVIVPVYNAEDYLRDTLDAISKQTLKEIEIICVDDASTDSSPDIIKEYAEKDARFLYILQEKGYAGAARNKGLENARGNYVIFWDSDDLFKAEALECMYERIIRDQADICVCGAKQFFTDKKGFYPADWYLNPKRIPETGCPFSIRDNEDYILNFTTLVPWNKLYRRAFIEEKKLRFKEIQFSNDTYFNTMGLCLADRITIYDEELVYYRRANYNSLTGKVSADPFIPVHTWMDAAEDLQKMGIFPEKSFANKTWGNYLYLLRNADNMEIFFRLVRYFKEEAGEKLHIRDQEDGYYYNKWQHSVLRVMLQEDEKSFYEYLAKETYYQWIKVHAESARFKEESIKYKGEIKKRKSEIQSLKKEKEKLCKDKQKLEKENQKIKASWSFRIGHIIVFLPGIVKRLCSRS